ncbi:hypothetical protein RE476_04870 [Methanolobus mangrovi]|uniref:N-acetyltransferase domain-containing protein n=1 Tax=Methanolobus mangrovi TaxID=3072977 RepID=A0AA51YK00_9EURY|nr:hypothetical protein [Methanolobus mangrovi]WMW23165.1 hypothetical protein RE476_04870 [Methanolobus mangrovi]
MFELARTDDGISFCKLEHAFELDKLKIGEFSYFRKYLGMADYFSNFNSWLKRPTVALVLAISGNTVVGWAMNEKWSSPSTDGRPVYVLRGIEISPQLARRGVGKNMFFLIANVLLGHVITKPVNKNAKLFFESLNFVEPSSSSPVNLGDYPGYLILDEGKKELLSFEDISVFESNIMSCKAKIFPKEICLETAKNDVNTAEANDCAVLETVIVADSQTAPLTPSEDENVADSQDPIVFDGKFVGEQKMMSPCKCGHYLVYKYQVTGKRKGTAFICASCNVERYFLPLKNLSK